MSGEKFGCTFQSTVNHWLQLGNSQTTFPRGMLIQYWPRFRFSELNSSADSTGESDYAGRCRIMVVRLLAADNTLLPRHFEHTNDRG